MTPAITLAKKHKIAFTLHEYQHDTNAESYGLEAAEKLNIPVSQVFKTLVVQTDKNELAVAILPVHEKLNFKKIAKALAAKKASMADPSLVERSTGYVLGGVSPLGQKKRLKTIIHASANEQGSIFVSAGKRGLEIELSAKELARTLNASFHNIIL